MQSFAQSDGKQLFRRETALMSRHPEGRRHGMEKRVIGIFRRPYAALITLTFVALTANAQLIVNPSFETPAISNYVFAPDFNGVIVTNSGALGWSFSELTARSGTNCPCPSL